MEGMTRAPPLLFWISKGDLTRIAYAKFHEILMVGYILNEFKWISSFRCHCHLVEYPNMPLSVFWSKNLYVRDEIPEQLAEKG